MRFGECEARGGTAGVEPAVALNSAARSVNMSPLCNGVSKLFLGLPRPFLGVVAFGRDKSAECSSPFPPFCCCMNFFGPGVAILVSNDFRGLPLLLLTCTGEESSAPFNGTVVVVVRPVTFLVGDFEGLRLLFFPSCFSASTVTCILQGLRRFSV